MNKLYDRIYWHNDTTPALNDSNLNAMSKAIDDIDDRVVELAADIMTDVPAVKEYLEQADELVDTLEEMTSNPPYIGENGNWYTWDTETGTYVDSGIDASITVSVGTTTTLPAGSDASVTNSGTDTDPILNFGIPQGDMGQPGEDGISPEVTITSIAGGHRVTITDADHPSGQSFDVMDGAGAGDMKASVYDPSSTVANAGGIAAYVAGQVPAAQIQSDWNQSDNTAKDFIKNKPTSAAAAYGGADESLVTTGEKYEWDSHNEASLAEYGTASASAKHYQALITRQDGHGAYAQTVVAGSGYFEIANTSATTYTFTSADFTADTVYDVYTDTYGDNPSDVVGSAGQCVVTFDEAKTRTVRIYIK